LLLLLMMMLMMLMMFFFGVCLAGCVGTKLVFVEKVLRCLQVSFRYVPVFRTTVAVSADGVVRVFLGIYGH
jgi:hypothetical protein